MSRLVRMLAALAALAVIALVAVGGCGRSSPDTPVSHMAISRTAAAGVLADYTTRMAQLSDGGRTDRLSTVVSGPNEPIEVGRLKIAAHYAQRNGNEPAGEPGGLARPSYWIPKLTGGPQWFVVSGVRPGTGDAVLLVFARPDKRHRFTAAYRVTLPAPVTLPRVRTSGRGVRAAPLAGSRLAVRPDTLADLHARIVQYGGSTSGGASVEPGSSTTAVHATLSRDIRQAAKRGFRYRRTYHASGYPAYALRTKTGGALVWYSVADELSVNRTDRSVKRPLKLSRDMAGIVGRSKIRRSCQVASVREYLAYVPPRGKGKVRVLGAAGGPVGGIGR